MSSAGDNCCFLKGTISNKDETDNQSSELSRYSTMQGFYPKPRNILSFSTIGTGEDAACRILTPKNTH